RDPEPVADALEREGPRIVAPRHPLPCLRGQPDLLHAGADLARDAAERVAQNRPHQRPLALSRCRRAVPTRVAAFPALTFDLLLHLVPALGSVLRVAGVAARAVPPREA